MEIINETPTQENQVVTYAGFWWRFLAALIDGIVLNIAQSFIVIPFLGVIGLTMFNIDQGNFTDESILLILSAIIPLISLSFFSGWLYYAIMESSKIQGTVGKMVLNIRVTDMDGQRISFIRASGRHFGKIISGMIMLIGYIMAGFTDKKQALHDMMAGCLVIKK